MAFICVIGAGGVFFALLQCIVACVCVDRRMFSAAAPSSSVLIVTRIHYFANSFNMTTEIVRVAAGASSLYDAQKYMKRNNLCESTTCPMSK